MNLQDCGKFVCFTDKAQDFAMVTKEVKNAREKPTWELLHGRLGHLSVEAIKKLSKMATGLEIPANPSMLSASHVFLLNKYAIFHISQAIVKRRP